METDSWVEGLVKNIVKCYENGGKVLICGNGGLAAESEHFAAELMGKYAFDCFVPCIALTCNSSLVTAISNDMDFSNVFAHQARVLGKENDLLIGMTTSSSINIIRALLTAPKGIMCVLIAGENGEKVYKGENPGAIYWMGGVGTAEIQENIIKFLHKVAYEVKKELYEYSARKS